MNRNSIKLPPADSELVRLVELMCDGIITPAERDRLELLLENDRDAKLFYIAYLDLHAHMQWTMREGCADEVAGGQWLVASEEGAGRVASGQWLVASEEGSGVRDQGSEEEVSGQWSVASESDIESRNPEIAKSQIPNLPSPAPNLQPPVSIVLDDSTLAAPLASLPFYISHPFVFSNLFAMLVIGIGALGAWFYQVDIPQPVAQSGRWSINKNKTVGSKDLEFVGRVTGMVDVKWADINTSTETGNGVPLGRKYAMSSGLMEITYHTGAKVILQGPVAYEVTSRDGGFLSVGKLTARLEKRGESQEKRSEVSGQRSGKVASGQWSVASEEGAGVRGQGSETANQKSSLSTIHYPLFAIKTPTATVTDLGTEFGVEVKKSGVCETQVFSGVVEVQLTRSGAEADTVGKKLFAGQTASIEPTGPMKIIHRVESPSGFVRSLQGELNGRAKATPQQYAPSLATLRDGLVTHLPLKGNADAGLAGTGGTVKGGIPWYSDAKFGRVAGVSYNTGSIRLNDNIGAMFENPRKHFTVSMWIKYSSVPDIGDADPPFFCNKDWANGLNRGLTLCLKNVNSHVYVMLNVSDGVNRIDVLGDINADVWSHVLATIDRNEKSTLYINGKDVSSAKTPIGSLDGKNHYVLQNGVTGSYGCTAVGLCTAEFAAWNRILNQDEIRHLASNRVGKPMDDIQKDGTSLELQKR